MRAATVARAYAETLFELGRTHGLLEPYAATLEQLTALLESDARVRAFIETPKIGAAAKKAALAKALGPGVPPLFTNFIGVVFDKRRERLLAAIGTEFVALLDEHLGRVHAQVTLARRPTAESERAITDQLGRTLGRQVIPRVRVDESILGGIVVRYGDRVLDGSLRRRLLSLRNRLRHAGVPSGF